MVLRQRDYRYRDMEDSMPRTTLPQPKRLHEIDWPACKAPRTLVLSTHWPRSPVLSQVHLALDVAFGTRSLRVIDEIIRWAVSVNEASPLQVSPLKTLFEAGFAAKVESNEPTSGPKDWYRLTRWE